MLTYKYRIGIIILIGLWLKLMSKGKEAEKQMKNSVFNFVLMLLCIVLLVTVAVYGIYPLGIKGVFEDGAVRKGLDLVGGSSVMYEAVAEEGKEVEDMDASMDVVVSILRSRITGEGYTEATVARVGENRVRVEIPEIQDPEEAIQMLGSTAKLTFVDSNDKVVLEGTDIKSAAAVYGPVSETGASEWYVSLEFNSEAVEKFSVATEEMAKLSTSGKNYIAIKLDDQIISQPYVTSKITQKDCVISGGGFDAEYAKTLANLISSGQLPLVLNEVETRTVGPTLGDEALRYALIAGAIGLLLVMLFMIIVYRLPGVVSALALVAYIAIIGIIIVAGKINLSLPGIAGIFLTIGMAVDANVVIYERIKEELSFGKSVKAAVKAGFSRAFTAILDSNITTLIAAVVLWIFGTGPIQGFAITLFVGVVVALFTTLVVSKMLLNSFVKMNINNVKLFGGKAPEKML